MMETIGIMGIALVFTVSLFLLILLICLPYFVWQIHSLMVSQSEHNKKLLALIRQHIDKT